MPYSQFNVYYIRIFSVLKVNREIYPCDDTKVKILDCNVNTPWLDHEWKEIVQT